MDKKDFLELEKKIEHNEKIIEKNEKIINKNAEIIEKIINKIEENANKIQANSFALEFVKDFKKELKYSRTANIIQFVIIILLSIIILAHHLK